MRRRDPGMVARQARLRRAKAGFTLIEVLAALAVTGLLVAVVLPYAGRLATRWWTGEQTVEAADAWMQAVGRLGDDVAQAVPYGIDADGGAPGAAFLAGPDGIRLVRPALGGAGDLESVSYEVRPSPAGEVLVRRSRRFDASAFGRDVGGAAATLLDGPARLRLVVVAADGTRRRDWSPADGMPAAVELSAAPMARGAAAPAAPVLMPVAARAPAAAKPGGAGGK